MAVAFTPAVPGAPEIVVEPDLLRGPRVLVGGERVLPRRQRGRPTFPISMADGSERPLTLHGAFLGLRARFEEREYEIERRLSWLELFMVVLPLALLTIAPPAGVVAGAVGVMVNLLLMRRPWPLGGRVVAAAAVVAGGYLLVVLSSGALLG
jgi:hypothetical protein